MRSAGVVVAVGLLVWIGGCGGGEGGDRAAACRTAGDVARLRRAVPEYATSNAGRQALRDYAERECGLDLDREPGA